jgi:hypothetical protein
LLVDGKLEENLARMEIFLLKPKTNSCLQEDLQRLLDDGHEGLVQEAKERGGGPKDLSQSFLVLEERRDGLKRVG